MKLVKILNDEEGEKIDNPEWCCVSDYSDGDRSLCRGQVYGEGESRVLFREKEGSTVTCKQCIAILEYLKKYKYKKP